MGRHAKTLAGLAGIDRRNLGYYSTPPWLAEYVVNRQLQLRPGLRAAFDPCVGEGAFVRPLLQRGIRCAGIDIHDFPARPPEISFTQGDFLRRAGDSQATPLLSCQRPWEGCDAWVINPPYNCHEVDYVRANKGWLDVQFGDLGTANMYAMFIAAAIRSASYGTALGIVTLDSFLTARIHEPLRRLILSECRIHDLLLAPTDLFLDQKADVRTCVMLLVKDRAGTPPDWPIRTLNRPATSAAFRAALATEAFDIAPRSALVLQDERDNAEFVIGVPKEIRNLLGESRIGDNYKCITGISTGNDAKYLRPTKHPGFSVPFYKNPGSKKFYCEPCDFLCDNFDEVSRQDKNFMVRNRQLLELPGIVCSSMGVPFSACYRPEQTTFGVNANIVLRDQDWWLLSYLNSTLATYLVRGILNRSNMITSGYVSRIPVPEFSRTIRDKLSRIAREAVSKKISPSETRRYVRLVNDLVFADLGLSLGTQMILNAFCADLLRTT